MPSTVRVVDVNMPFLSMVAFMVKWVLASIPALVILTFLAVLLAGVFGDMVRPFRP